LERDRAEDWIRCAGTNAFHPSRRAPGKPLAIVTRISHLKLSD
jgi:hypothetical protein